MDHNQNSLTGHDIYREGLHIDIDRRTAPPVHLKIQHRPLPEEAGKVVRGCVEYVRKEAEYIIGVFEGDISPPPAPRWESEG